MKSQMRLFKICLISLGLSASLSAAYGADFAQSNSEKNSPLADRLESGSISAASLLFQASYDSNNWNGNLIAYERHQDGSVNPVPVWQAANMLDAETAAQARVILTYNSEAAIGIFFHFPTDYRMADLREELSHEQINQLLRAAPQVGSEFPSDIVENQLYGENLVNYLRGERGLEGSAQYQFRPRSSVLGDIIASNPLYVGGPSAGYPEEIESNDSYQVFKKSYRRRENMVYVGANDGMLHGFSASNGRERLAFIPNAVFSNLADLSDSAYTHHDYVNATAVVVDAYLDESVDPVDGQLGLWRSVLVGGLGGGGQAIYALDVTDPRFFSHTNAARIVLWEFAHNDLGYSYAQPSIAKMADGRWVSVFGNGYHNSTADGSAGDGKASLFIVDIDNGKLIKQINTGFGSSANPNGLSSPALIDIDGDYIVDTIYAGDLAGNMWKFDVSSSSDSDWDIAYYEEGVPKPLFTTFNHEAITAKPQVSNHPDNLGGYMLFFTSGQYLEGGDGCASGANTKTLYGIWDKADKNFTVINANNLLAQTMDGQNSTGVDTDDTSAGEQIEKPQLSSDNAIDFTIHDGWHIDLTPEQRELNTSSVGEILVTDVLVRNGRITFRAQVLAQGSCSASASSYIIALDSRNGGKLGFAAFDLNGDGIFDQKDEVAAGLLLNSGIVVEGSLLQSTETNTALTYFMDADGNILMLEANPGSGASGRLSWRQIK